MRFYGRSISILVTFSINNRRCLSLKSTERDSRNIFSAKYRAGYFKRSVKQILLFLLLARERRGVENLIECRQSNTYGSGSFRQRRPRALPGAVCKINNAKRLRASPEFYFVLYILNVIRSSAFPFPPPPILTPVTKRQNYMTEIRWECKTLCFINMIINWLAGKIWGGLY